MTQDAGRVCALVAACEFNAEYFARVREQGLFDAVYAVDGGYAHLKELGCKPDVVIGDFDSLGYVPADERIERHPVQKDASDLELALDAAKSEGFDSVYVFGALGGRLDHTLGNFQICARHAEEGARVRIVGDAFAVSILVGPATLELPRFAEGTVSVFSATDRSTGVTERGMTYPLEGGTLTNRTTLGLSNELCGERATVSVENGTLYIFHPLS